MAVALELSEDQQAARVAVEGWLSAGYDPARPVFRLFGWAGSGKSSIARVLAEGRRAAFAAYTGKAALEMRKRGCADATTLHSILYQPQDRPRTRLRELFAELEAANNKIIADRVARRIEEEEEKLKKPDFRPRGGGAGAWDLLVVDEVSMVDERMGQDILDLRVPVLCLGDPGQLPPIKGAGFFDREPPDVMLSQIHRQAEASPILRMATKARLGEDLSHGDYGQGCAVIEPGALSIQDVCHKFDQVICGTNKMRRALNHRIRTEVLGRKGPLPEPGDRVICLRNDHRQGTLNGSQWIVGGSRIVDDDRIMLTVEPVEDLGRGCETRDLLTYRHHFEGREKDLPHWREIDAQEFDHACAITCHKSQGSQWSKVLVVDESRVFRAEAARWLYTAITRAVDEVVVRR